MLSLDSYLQLTPAEARAQWGHVLRREQRKRQEKFSPVEVILCFGLFFVLNPHKYGGRTMDRAPRIIHQLASLFVRPPASITNKMLNLDGSRANAGAHEWRFFVEMATGSDRYPHLYNCALNSARDMGIGPEALPDFLALAGVGNLELLGQDELTGPAFEAAVEAKAAEQRARSLGQVAETDRLVEQRVRIGQHRFASDVLDNFGHSCGFCDFSPRSLPGNKLLVASHIKPWADSDDNERLDPSNGVAACPTHDAAFDSGLITINGGLRVHRAPRLEESATLDPGVGTYFGGSMQSSLALPDQAAKPGARYLKWHRERIFQGDAAALQ